MMERPPDREKKHSKSLIRTGCFGHSAAYGAFYAVRDVLLRHASNVNRIAYLARFQREKMRESWMKMEKTKTISVINEEICCK